MNACTRNRLNSHILILRVPVGAVARDTTMAYRPLIRRTILKLNCDIPIMRFVKISSNKDSI